MAHISALFVPSISRRKGRVGFTEWLSATEKTYSGLSGSAARAGHFVYQFSYVEATQGCSKASSSAAQIPLLKGIPFPPPLISLCMDNFLTAHFFCQENLSKLVEKPNFIN